MTIEKALFTSESGEWETPLELFKTLNKITGGFSVDAASTPKNSKTTARLTDGLKNNWMDGTWCNPPYGNPENPCKPNCEKKKCYKRGHHTKEYQPGIIDWTNKAISSKVSSCLLLPARTETKWGQRALLNCSTVVFLSGRLKFEFDGQPVANEET